jgi:GT2 family glycosyltransferase
MKLSIVIVNYNVKYFLEQCLHSVFKAIHSLEVEIFVVDNNSVDGSCGMIKQKFPQVKLIENKNNVGFSKANNQAIRISQGEYVLLLNPDTVVEEDTFDKVTTFMDAHPDAGGLGVKMIDGKGIFLPESKRGLPTPMVAFYKIFGLSKLFPHSRRFSKYHLGFLNKNQIHEVEVLSGAFMLIRKETLEKVGLLDEDYFMYGEDIDLSYRISLGGYKNYYFPETTIIHYKGESTKKGSINYVKVFYNAMIIFARKHFSKKNARLFTFFIALAIYFRAVLALLNRLVRVTYLPVCDALLLFFGFWFIAPYWEPIKYPEGGTFPAEYFSLAIPAYIIVWLASVFFSGGYDRPVKISRLIRGMLVGTGFILIVYALLPESFRFSRAMILLGMTGGLLNMVAIRGLLHLSRFSAFRFDFVTKNRIAIVGDELEASRVQEIIKHSMVPFEYIGLICPREEGSSNQYIGTLSQLKEIVVVNRINELIFCASNLPAQKIIGEMLSLENSGVSFKIAPPESVSIIGSNSIDTAGDLYTVDFNNITRPHNLRKKRMFDLISSLILFCFTPILILFVPNRLQMIANILSVLFGFKTWVGFHSKGNGSEMHLPKIKVSIVSWAEINAKYPIMHLEIEKLNLLYAKDYHLMNDVLGLSKSILKLGKT